MVRVCGVHNFQFGPGAQAVPLRDMKLSPANLYASGRLLALL